MTVTREILWNVRPWAVATLYLTAALATMWIAAWFVRRSRLWRYGTRAIHRFGYSDGAKRLAGYLLTHRTIARDRYAGVMHFLIFWGFLAELLATTLVAVQHDFGLVFLTGTTYLVFSFGADLGGLMLAAGLSMALWRRRSPEAHGRLERRKSITALLWLLLAITATGFFLEAARISATGFPPFEKWSFVGYGLARLAPLGASGHRLLWLFHAALVVLFFVVIPLSLMRHIFLGAYSVMRPAGVPGTLSPMEDVLVPAPASLANFRAFDLLQADACLTCGRCAEVCPAKAAGKPLSPRSVVLGLRASLGRDEGFPRIEDAALWSCTTCNACDTACPIGIHIVDKIASLRRAKTIEGKLPATAAQALESTAQYFNPFQRPNSARMEWASGLSIPVAKEEEPVDLLYWVGCAGAFDPQGREVTRAMTKIFSRLGIAFRVLGCGERCTGDPARRLGEEGLWRELARENQASFNRHRVKTILTSCPHCFNAFKNEYPVVGTMPEVVHHSQWLKERIDSGALKLKASDKQRVTFHDPCYLARANDEIEAPRRILDAVATDRAEMAASGKNGFCCGGGGGQMWLDVRGRERVEAIRASHVEKTGAATVATGCPFCRVMLEAGRAALPEGQGKWRVRDVAELVAEALPEGGA